MSAEENKASDRRFWEEVFNGRKLSLMDEFIAPDWVYHGPAGQEMHGPKELKQLFSMYFNAFPDLHADIEDIIAEGDKVAIRVMCRGTHKGEIMGIAPTGRQIKVPLMGINRFKDHQAVETFELIDIFGMLQQLGSA